MGLHEIICEEVNFPICRTLKIETSPWACDFKEPVGVPIYAPYTVAVLLISVLCAIRMILHVNSLYASIGRGEMRTIFILYIISSLFQAALVAADKHMPKHIQLCFTVIQISAQSSLYFAIFVAGITIDRIYGIFGMASATFMRILTGIFLVTIFCFSFICCNTPNPYIIPILFTINMMSVLLYILGQASRLKKVNSDIWAYGILAIIFIIYGVITAFMVFGSELIAEVSERNVDNLFFITLLSFMLVMMIHKYWLSTCDFELECLSLPA